MTSGAMYTGVPFPLVSVRGPLPEPPMDDTPKSQSLHTQRPFGSFTSTFAGFRSLWIMFLLEGHIVQGRR